MGMPRCPCEFINGEDIHVHRKAQKGWQIEHLLQKDSYGKLHPKAFLALWQTEVTCGTLSRALMDPKSFRCLFTGQRLRIQYQSSLASES